MAPLGPHWLEEEWAGCILQRFCRGESCAQAHFTAIGGVHILVAGGPRPLCLTDCCQRLPSDPTCGLSTGQLATQGGQREWQQDLAVGFSSPCSSPLLSSPISSPVGRRLT